MFVHMQERRKIENKILKLKGTKNLLRRENS